METNYNVDYFISKFEKIHELDFIKGDWHHGAASCSNGHCGLGKNNYKEGTKESNAFNKLFINMNVIGVPPHQRQYSWGISAAINDGSTEEYQQPTPKLRILAALYDIKKLQQPQPEKSETIVIEKIKYVSVPESIKKEISVTSN